LIADIKIVTVKKCFILDQEHKLNKTMTALTGSIVMYTVATFASTNYHKLPSAKPFRRF